MNTTRGSAHRRISRRSLLLGGTATVLTVGTASAWALDEYVIDHVQVNDAAAFESASGSSGTALDTSNAVATSTSWSADGTTITVTRTVAGSGADQVTYVVADLRLTDATVLRTGLAHNEFGQNIVANTSAIATQNNAVFAVNGDYYGFRDAGIEIRNGTVYRSTPAREAIALYRDGHGEVYDETATSSDKLLADDVWTTLSFGPALVSAGAVLDGIEDVEIDTNFGNHSIQGQQPRTAIGIIDDNHLVFVVVDGRDPGYSRGVTMGELAAIFVDLGARTAYNLDGGGSSTMYFQGEVVNRPSEGDERGVSDILYVAG